MDFGGLAPCLKLDIEKIMGTIIQKCIVLVCKIVHSGPKKENCMWEQLLT